MNPEITIHNIYYDGKIWIGPNSFTLNLDLSQFRVRRVHIEDIGIFRVRPESRILYTESENTKSILMNLVEYFKDKRPLGITVASERERKTRK